MGLPSPNVTHQQQATAGSVVLTESCGIAATTGQSVSLPIVANAVIGKALVDKARWNHRPTQVLGLALLRQLGPP
ncbi:hypothetical protein D9M71_818680 [compost metagenome]